MITDNEPDGRPSHNAEDCDGAFRAVYNSGGQMDRGPSALVCPACGAWRPIEQFEEHTEDE